MSQTPVTDKIEATLGAHVLQYGPAIGQICSCGRTTRRVSGDERPQQEKHTRHVAEVISSSVYTEGLQRGTNQFAEVIASGLSPSAEKSLREGAYWVRLGRRQALEILSRVNAKSRH